MVKIYKNKSKRFLTKPIPRYWISFSNNLWFTCFWNNLRRIQHQSSLFNTFAYIWSNFDFIHQNQFMNEKRLLALCFFVWVWNWNVFQSPETIKSIEQTTIRIFAWAGLTFSFSGFYIVAVFEMCMLLQWTFSYCKSFKNYFIIYLTD